MEVKLKRVCPICGFEIRDGESRKYWESADRRRRGYIHRYCDPLYVGDDPAVVKALAAHVDPGPYAGDPDG